MLDISSMRQPELVKLYRCVLGHEPQYTNREWLKKEIRAALRRDPWLFEQLNKEEG